MPGTTSYFVSTGRDEISLTLCGLRFDPRNPLEFEFLFDEGTTSLTDEQLKIQSQRLVNYFLSAMALPESDLWVNLSPYEPERIIAPGVERTELGRDMLMQDYFLKRLSASLTHPDTPQGKEYWSALQNFKSQISNLPSKDALGGQKFGEQSSLAKVWIVPGETKITSAPGMVLLTSSRLKVKTENVDPQFARHILPAIDKDINDGKDFAALRQMYNAVVLAYWFKTRLKGTVYHQDYINRKAISGIALDENNIKEKLYGDYLAAFKAGAYRYMKNERQSGRLSRRAYFSGGVMLDPSKSPSFTADTISSQTWLLAKARAVFGNRLGTLIVRIVQPPQRAKDLYDSVTFMTGHPHPDIPAMSYRERMGRVIVGLGAAAATIGAGSAAYNMISSISTDAKDPQERSIEISLEPQRGKEKDGSGYAYDNNVMVLPQKSGSSNIGQLNGRKRPVKKFDPAELTLAVDDGVGLKKQPEPFTHTQQGDDDHRFVNAQVDPVSSRAFVNRGTIHLHQGRFDEAIESYTRAIALDHKNIEAYRLRSVAYSYRSSPGDALLGVKDTKTMLDLDPYNPEANAEMGSSWHFLAKKRIAGMSDSEYDTLLKTPSMREYAAVLGVSVDDPAMRDKVLRKALEYIERAIAGSPEQSTFYIYRAWVKYEMLDSTGALADLQQSLTLTRYSDPYVYMNMVSYYMNEKQYQQVIQNAGRGIELIQNNNAQEQEHIIQTLRSRRGVAYYHLGDYQNAIKDLEPVAASPDNSEARTTAREYLEKARNAGADSRNPIGPTGLNDKVHKGGIDWGNDLLSSNLVVEEQGQLLESSSKRVSRIDLSQIRAAIASVCRHIDPR